MSVKGRLRGALAFWNDVHAPQFILDVIEYGYKLPLLQIPLPFTAKNNSSALEQPAFVESAINDLIINGCVTEVFEAPVIINPLSVSIPKSGKKRLILDLRRVNQFLYKCRFRCEDLSIAKEVLNPGDFMFTFDSKSSYHHVNIPGAQEVPIICVDFFLRTHQIFPVFCSSVWPQFRALFIY